MTPQELLAACSPDVVAVTDDGIARNDAPHLWKKIPEYKKHNSADFWYWQSDRGHFVYWGLNLDWSGLPPERRIVTRADLEK